MPSSTSSTTTRTFEGGTAKALSLPRSTESTPLVDADNDADAAAAVHGDVEDGAHVENGSGTSHKVQYGAARMAATKTAEGARAAATMGKDAASKAYEGAIVGAKATADFTSRQVASVKDFVMDGPVPFRVLAFGGGGAIVGAAIRDMVEKNIFVDIFQTLASMFNVYFGVIMMLLESSALFKRTPWRRDLYAKASFLKTTFGRGFFYTFIGINMCAQNFSVFGMCVGLYVQTLGILAISVGWWTQRKLTKLRVALRDEDMVVNTFKEMDVDKNGQLDVEEFASLCDRLGVPMKRVQLMAVFDVIDTSDVGVRKNTITLEEFCKWWSEWDDLVEVI